MAKSVNTDILLISYIMNNKKSKVDTPYKGSWAEEMNALRNGVVFISNKNSIQPKSNFNFLDSKKKIIPNEDCVTLYRCDKHGNKIS